MAYRVASDSLFGQVIKTPLRYSGYYYAHGVVSAATLTIDLGPVGFNADGRAGWYWSIDSADPAQIEHSARGLAARLSHLFDGGRCGRAPWSAGFRFGLAVEHVRRASYMLDYRRDRRPRPTCW